eukprot:INCI7181.1.p1 GENE.INCI7181.1~~INCI7181.1.p1  ORF type:complete len:111 (+),score=4.35 INCI7181.1:73-405(+)
MATIGAAARMMPCLQYARKCSQIVQACHRTLRTSDDFPMLLRPTNYCDPNTLPIMRAPDHGGGPLLGTWYGSFGTSSVPDGSLQHAPRLIARLSLHKLTIDRQDHIPVSQ